VIDAIQSVQVTSGKDKSGFQITFAVSKNSTLLKTLLPPASSTRSRRA